MATHNGEKFLSEQLASILIQLDSTDELIISDDSSTDGTLSIIAKFSDSRIKVIEGNTFFSPIYNIENAIKYSKGEIIVLSDQDDVWLDNRLSIIQKRFSSKKTKITTIVTNGQIIDEHGRIIHESIFDNLQVNKGVLKNLYRNTYMGCCMSFTRDLLKLALPFPPNIPMHDSWLGILSELYGTVEYVPDKTILYRLHPSNRSFRKFTVKQQLRWRYYLAYHLFQRALSQPSGLIMKELI
jgi:glycosyltransferase involved in cell wall biosynthesis